MVDGVGWSGSALMLVYHIGVLEELVKAKVYVPGKTRTAGSSGGSYIAVSTTTGTTAATLQQHYYELVSSAAAEQKACGTAPECNPAAGRLEPLTRTLLNNVITNSSRKLKRANNKALTHLTLFTQSIKEPLHEPNCTAVPATNWTIKKYRNRADVIDALSGSSYISSASAANCAQLFRGKPVRDGGYSVHLPCPPYVKRCLSVEALIPPQYKNTRCPGLGLADVATQDPDIYPGLSGEKMPLTFCEWQQASMDPSLAMAHYDAILALARKDALAWIKANGWA